MRSPVRHLGAEGDLEIFLQCRRILSCWLPSVFEFVLGIDLLSSIDEETPPENIKKDEEHSSPETSYVGSIKILGRKRA